MIARVIRCEMYRRSSSRDIKIFQRKVSNKCRTFTAAEEWGSQRNHFCITQLLRSLWTSSLSSINWSMKPSFGAMDLFCLTLIIASCNFILFFIIKKARTNVADLLIPWVCCCFINNICEISFITWTQWTNTVPWPARIISIQSAAWWKYSASGKLLRSTAWTPWNWILWGL